MRSSDVARRGANSASIIDLRAIFTQASIKIGFDDPQSGQSSSTHGICLACLSFEGFPGK